MAAADIVILGGSAAGVTAAITPPRHHADRSILLVRKEKQVPIPCGIPYIYGTLGTCAKATWRSAWSREWGRRGSCRPCG